MFHPDEYEDTTQEDAAFDAQERADREDDHTPVADLGAFRRARRPLPPVVIHPDDPAVA